MAGTLFAEGESMNKTGATVVTEQPPPYAATSIHLPPGTIIGTGVNPAMGVGMHNPGYNHNGPMPMVRAHHNGLVTTVAGGMAITSFTAKPAHITCQSCNAAIVTKCERKLSWKTHFFALSLALVCCWPCCCMVYCINDCKNADHYCPQCNSYIGSYII